MYCKNCGKKIPDDSKFCPSCGQPMNPLKRRNANDDVEAVPVIIRRTDDLEAKRARRAKQASKEALAIGILFCITEILSAVLFFFYKSIPDNVYYLILSFDIHLATAELVLIVVLLTRWFSVKKYTKHSHLWITIGYPCAFAASLALMIVVFWLMKSPEDSQSIIVWNILQMCIDLFIIFISFFNYVRIKKTYMFDENKK